MIWVLQAEYGYEYDLSWVGPLNGQELLSAADQVFNQYWQGHFATGSSCDFGGAAELHDIPRNMSLGNYSYLFNGTDDAAGYFAQEGGPAGAHGSSGGGEEDGEASGGMGGAASDAPAGPVLPGGHWSRRGDPSRQVIVAVVGRWVQASRRCWSRRGA